MPQRYGLKTWDGSAQFRTNALILGGTVVFLGDWYQLQNPVGFYTRWTGPTGLNYPSAFEHERALVANFEKEVQEGLVQGLFDTPAAVANYIGCQESELIVGALAARPETGRTRTIYDASESPTAAYRHKNGHQRRPPTDTDTAQDFRPP
eukprot:6202284-Amphidinium_carterae.1